MKTICLHARGGPEAFASEEAPQPRPGEGEVLVRVHAAGVIQTELSWVPTWSTQAGEPRPLPVIPGHEFSGAIAALGAGVRDVGVGDLVYGLNDWYRDGAQAEYCLARVADLAGAAGEPAGQQADDDEQGPEAEVGQGQGGRQHRRGSRATKAGQGEGGAERRPLRLRVRSGVEFIGTGQSPQEGVGELDGAVGGVLGVQAGDGTERSQAQDGGQFAGGQPPLAGLDGVDGVGQVDAGRREGGGGGMQQGAGGKAMYSNEYQGTIDPAAFTQASGH
jgi:hypothetical protein